MIQNSVLNKEALACKNATYLRTEAHALRTVKQASTAGIQFTRMIHVEPANVCVHVKPDALQQIHAQQARERDAKR